MASIFVRTRPATNWAASTAYSLGDRRKATAAALGIHFEVTTAGTSHSSEPTWNTTVGGTTSDGTVTWTTRGSANTWVALTAYVLGDRVCATSAATAARQNYVWECTTAGTSGVSEPTWTTTTPDTSTNSDGTVTWTLRKCSTWNNAHIFVANVTKDTSGTGKTNAGDTIYIGDEHNETTAASITIQAPVSLILPSRYLCVNDTGDPSSPSTLATSARVAITGSSVILTVSGYSYWYGVQFTAGDGANRGTINVGGSSTVSGETSMDACQLNILGTSVLSQINLGSTAVTGEPYATLNNTTMSFGHASQACQVSGQVVWKNTPSALSGTLPTNLFTATVTAFLTVDGVDLSAMTSSNAISIGTLAVPVLIKLTNCKLGSGALLARNQPVNPGGVELNVINCDSGATNYITERDYLGVKQTTETTLVRSGGASDGTTPISWKLVSDANVNFPFPFTTFPIVLWNNNSGSSKTATVEILHDSATALKDDEIWLECEYLGASGSPLGSFVSDRKADILATGADQTSSAVTWTTTGMSNPNKQKLSVTFTPQQKGPVKAVVYLAKPSKTIYVDPIATLT